LTAEEMDKGATLFPSRALLKHEWAKHGTCTGLAPLQYLEKSDTALGAVVIPSQLQPLNTPPSLPAREIEALFRESNPRMGNHGMAVICKGNVLSEVRVCLTKDLAFTGCPRSVKSQCRGGDIRIPAQR
jgi:ribonuclease T2